MKAGIPAKAKDMALSVHVTEAGEDIIALAEEAVRNSADVLGVSGGDGTLAAVATVAMRHNLPLVVCLVVRVATSPATSASIRKTCPTPAGLHRH